MPEKVLTLTPPVPITCVAYNKDRTQMALSPNSSVIQIYKKNGSSWVLDVELKEHDKLVTGIDWAPNSNRIVSCSQDRNAYVWTLGPDGWKQALVILRLNRAATAVKWSPDENKFAVASGARCISVCYFDEENDWWVAKHIRKPIRSTVLSLSWHPNNAVLACGAADFKARVFAAAIKGVDKKPEPTVWGDKKTFGDCLAEFTHAGCGWVHDVAFSADGNQLAYVAHDSSLSVVYGGGEVKTVRTANLPFRAVEWVASGKLVAAGHDRVPILFSGDASKNWKMEKSLEASSGSSGKAGVGSAMNKFREMDLRGREEGGDSHLSSTHQNAINGMVILDGSTGNVKKLSTIGVDGVLVNWTL